MLGRGLQVVGKLWSAAVLCGPFAFLLGAGFYWQIYYSGEFLWGIDLTENFADIGVIILGMSVISVLYNLVRLRR